MNSSCPVKCSISKQKSKSEPKIFHKSKIDKTQYKKQNMKVYQNNKFGTCACCEQYCRLFNFVTIKNICHNCVQIYEEDMNKEFDFDELLKEFNNILK